MRKISIIVAVAENRVIGRDNNLPWRLAGDLKKFKEITTGHTIVMGRKTFESIGRALPNRVNIVITRNLAYEAPGCVVVHSLEEALKASGDDEEIFIIGGAQIFELALPIVDRIYYTEVKARPEGRVLFPDFEKAQWDLAKKEEYFQDENNEFSFDFSIYERKK
ncbi:MAG: dihydrofolate reductase [Candidatus Harrisonbacteria bacterium CG10_big_fil_rev_8_21_14_0_10_45_28]|uniref:Dihydrofolate reductase n=1 Tax=Candidatus Harrisonbacteria bacterium CG10_big_fil_rev_8_21_14_0_10_45_28 TaxID=1974586 RepID=A0A2H0UMV2_9BACT|nr:MAG: dihydrofolate reductase [Candidatus Harrisonbacteria bacterium CG10_big_fil_rev_8_21_14_0_10_45_28]